MCAVALEVNVAMRQHVETVVSPTFTTRATNYTPCVCMYTFTDKRSDRPCHENKNTPKLSYTSMPHPFHH